MRSSMKKKAFIFDLNGTMINDMPYHIDAWYNILNNLGAQLSMERMKEECYGKNSELLERIFPGRFSGEEMDRMIMEKEKAYQKTYAPHLKLIDGLYDFMLKANAAGIRQAIGSAAIMFNIDFVLDGTGVRKFIDTIVSADDVAESKPNPETFLMAAEKMNLAPSECLVFEDTPKGVEAALHAGMDAIVITSLHRPDEFKPYGNVIRFADNFHAFADLLPGMDPIN